MNIDPSVNTESRGTRGLDLTITQTVRGTLQVPAVQIEVVSGTSEQVATFDLGLLPSIIGTHPTCDIVVRDPHVSSEHCEVHLTQSGVVFRDKRSKNGSYFGNLQIAECTLFANASVRIGNTKLTIRYRGPREVPWSANDSFGADETLVHGHSLLMRTLFVQLERVCLDTRPIVLAGEAGTGRTLIAHAISKKIPNRPKFVAIDCQKLPRGKEAEMLFGTVDGGRRSGMLEKASGGIVFLGNIDELPPNVGHALVRVLMTQQIIPVGALQPQRNPFRSRVIASLKPRQLEIHGF
ncbi:MAG TPA: sigma 54-interacting transcriptional regulator, partial [Polyangium sp.]|nr:sigma 54-interacting transcriptional regulator [Polyangium sp.]